MPQIKKASLGQVAKLIKLIEDGEIGVGSLSEVVNEIAKGNYDAEFVQALIEKRVSFSRVTVPDLSSAQLIEAARKRFHDLDPDLVSWDFVRDERGKTFEFALFYTTMNQKCAPEQVHEYFRKLGMDGNIAAFIVWATCFNPAGVYSTIPSEDSQMLRMGDDLCTAALLRFPPKKLTDKLRSYLCLGHNISSASSEEDVVWAYVGFREVKPA